MKQAGIKIAERISIITGKGEMISPLMAESGKTKISQMEAERVKKRQITIKNGRTA